jgi:RimJ/RimL family protein N-acetyltransferase
VLGLIKQFRCKGLGTELAAAITDTVFLDHAMERIVGRVAVRNAKSLPLVSSVGMTEVGVVRNTHTGKDDVKFELCRPSVPNEHCS